MTMNCPECGDKASENGNTKAGVKKYICKSCRKSFNANYYVKKEAYTRTEQRLLAMLLSFLDAETDENLSLKQFLEISRKSNTSIKNIKLKLFKREHQEPLKPWHRKMLLLISKENDTIILTKFVPPLLDNDEISMNNGKIKIPNVN